VVTGTPELVGVVTELGGCLAGATLPTAVGVGVVGVAVPEL